MKTIIKNKFQADQVDLFEKGWFVDDAAIIGKASESVKRICKDYKDIEENPYKKTNWGFFGIKVLHEITPNSPLYVIHNSDYKGDYQKKKFLYGKELQNLLLEISEPEAEIINKTPHPVNIVDEDGNIIKTFSVCSKENLIRLEQKTERVTRINDIPISETKYGYPVGLNIETPGFYYIVSQLVKNALPSRKDLLVPAEIVRNENNNIVGCRSLGQ